MVHMSPEMFSSEGVLGRHHPNQKSYNAQLIFFLRLFFDSDIFVMNLGLVTRKLDLRTGFRG